MGGDYFDLHDILCEEQRVKVRFLQDTPWTHLLTLSDETTVADTHIAKGTVLEVPLWLARSLQAAAVLVVLPPRQFGSRVRADLAAGADAVSLRELSPYWYSLGAKMASLLPAEAIARTLRGALAGRLRLLARGIYCPTDGASDPHKTVFGVRGSAAALDHLEAAIYAATVAARKDADAWENRTDRLLRPLEIYTDSKF